MSHLRLLPFHLATVVLLVAQSWLMASPATFAEDTLRGGVEKEDYLKLPNSGPSLSRSDIKSQGDPFGGNQRDPVAVPNFSVDEITAAPPPQLPSTFDLSAQGNGQVDFQGQSMPGVPDNALRKPMNLSANQPGYAQPQLNPGDPDNSPEMQLAWDAWHKRVAEAIYIRFTRLSNAAFGRSRPLCACASYAVTRDGRIINVRLLQQSWNPVFNTMILAVINSINGDLSLLSYPPGSRRLVVEKSGTFTQNYGVEGYKHILGDRETIRPPTMQNMPAIMPGMFPGR